MGGNKYLIEAEVYGDGIKMWLLSQGAWVKVIAPDDFIEEIKDEIKKISNHYNLWMVAKNCKLQIGEKYGWNLWWSVKVSLGPDEEQ